MTSTYTAIRQGMRRNEADLLAHLRNCTVTHTMGFGMAWHNALDRLLAAGKVVYRKHKGELTGRYVAVKFARPVTPVVRP